MKSKTHYIAGVDEAGETVRGTVARPCLIVLEAEPNKSIDKVYSSCKVEMSKVTFQDLARYIVTEGKRYIRKVYSSCKEEVLIDQI